MNEQFVGQSSWKTYDTPTPLPIQVSVKNSISRCYWMKKSFRMNISDDTDLVFRANFAVWCSGVWGHQAYSNGRMLWKFTPPPRNHSLGEARLMVIGVLKGEMRRLHEYLRSHDRQARWRSQRPAQEAWLCGENTNLTPNPHLNAAVSAFLRASFLAASETAG